MGYSFLGKKVAMATALSKYKALPVTILDITENVIAGKRQINDRFALLIGFGKKKKATKAEQGVYKEIGFVPRVVKQVYVDEKLYNNIKVGDSINQLLESLTSSDEQKTLVDVTGVSKGKGFAGVIKRWGFHRQPKTHGQSDRERHPGAIGAQTPGRVFKGKKMAGRMGGNTVTVKNLEVVEIIEQDDKKYIVLKGPVPGAYGSVVTIKIR